MSIRLTRPTGCLALLIVLTASRLAGAQGSGSASAEALFQDGRMWLDAGDYSLACKKFAASLELEPAVGTLISLAECEEAQRDLVNARRHWRAAEALADAKNDPAGRAGFARERLKIADTRISRISIRIALGSPRSLVIDVDGMPLNVAALDEDLPLNPGDHTISVATRGRQTVRYAVALEESERKVVEVRCGEAIVSAKLQLPTIESSPGASLQNSAIVPRWQGPAGYVGIGIGLVGIGIGVPLAIAGNRAYDQSLGGSRGVGASGADQRWHSLFSASMLSMSVGAFSLVVGGTMSLAAAWSNRPIGADQEPTVPTWQQPLAYALGVLGISVLAVGVSLAASDVWGQSAGFCTSSSTSSASSTFSSTRCGSGGIAHIPNLSPQIFSLLLGGGATFTIGGTLWLTAAWAHPAKSQPRIAIVPAVDPNRPGLVIDGEW